MRTFRDANGVKWRIEINIATARKLRDRMKEVETLRDVDFLDYAALLLKLEDVFFAADLLYEICRDEATERGVDAGAFGAALYGKYLFDAETELTAEYIDFFPDAATTEKMRAVAEKAAIVRKRQCAAICNAVETALDVGLSNAENSLGANFSDDWGD